MSSFETPNNSPTPNSSPESAKKLAPASTEIEQEPEPFDEVVSNIMKKVEAGEYQEATREANLAISDCQKHLDHASKKYLQTTQDIERLELSFGNDRTDQAQFETSRDYKILLKDEEFLKDWQQRLKLEIDILNRIIETIGQKRDTTTKLMDEMGW